MVKTRQGLDETKSYLSVLIIHKGISEGAAGEGNNVRG